MVDNDIVHVRRKRHEKVACFGFIGLELRKDLSIECLVIGTSTGFSCVCVLLFVRGDVVCEDIGILHLRTEEGVKCVIKC